MGRKCSNCGKTGHNSRTCSSTHKRGININGHRMMKLFGVQFHLSSSNFAIKKSFTSFNAFINKSTSHKMSRFLYNGLIETSPEQIRKKGIPWSEEEHRIFLVGLEILGKGDWRGISRYFVTSRTPTQVASHAQKYFLRLNNLNYNNTKIIKRSSTRFHHHLEEKNKRINSIASESSISKRINPSTMINFSSNSDQLDSKSSSQISTESSHFVTSSWSRSIVNPNLDLQSCAPNLDLTLASPQITTIDQSKPSPAS
ncbi:hypothetical protein M9H77_34023 [Catharanthus roseus]|uniref:Uncharacterized protein n=1 Tax=Catharanthus roseus TaxID=4058 RepID=A0ACB9ZKC0_CATRO|nr:hypothetical protein M9H77_34023 [Catharanthus roseus]